METYNYLRAIKADVINYIGENPELLAEHPERDELEEALNEQCWMADDVTGNATGSYTLNRWQAEENLCHNTALLMDALEEIGGAITPDWWEPETMDVVIRCHLLGEAIAAVLDDMEAAGQFGTPDDPDLAA